MAASPPPLPRSLLEGLPLQVLEHICDLLVEPACNHVAEPVCSHMGGRNTDCHRDRGSLLAFSLASSTCAIAATRQRFARVHLVVETPSKLQQDLERLDRLLQNDRLQYVRLVKVTGSLLPKRTDGDDEDDWESTDDESSDAEEMDNYADSDLERITYNDHSEAGNADGDEQPSESSEPTGPTGPTEQQIREAWLLLAQLVSRLSGLTDLIYACTDQLPPSILSALHQHHPTSRLHVINFSLRSLIGARNAQREIDPDEYTLATSPCLYSLVAPWCRYKRSAVNVFDLDYNIDAIKEMVGGLAPGLKHVEVQDTGTGTGTGTGSLWELEDFFLDPMPAWEGFFPGRSEPSNKSQPRAGHLQSLCIDLLNTQAIEWDRYTAFDELQCLELGMAADRGVLSRLETLGRSGQLRSLRSLRLFIDSNKDSELPHLDTDISSVLQNLPPLHSLQLSGCIAQEAYMATLQHHAASLRELAFLPDGWFDEHEDDFVKSYALNHKLIWELAQQCTTLERLDILIPRSKGDEDEVDIYWHLGRLPRLKHLTLLLDVSWGEGEFGNPIVLRRNRLINAAVDATLAKEVFQIVESGSALETLVMKIEPPEPLEEDDLPHTSSGTLSAVLEWIGRGRKVVKDAHGQLVDKEADPKHTRELDQSIPDMLVGDTARVFRKLWPKKTGHWMDDWSSFPLA